MAYFKKRGTVWQAQISWYDANDRRRYKTKSGFRTKRQAAEWAHQMEVAKDDNTITNNNPTFVNYYRDWAETYRIPNHSQSTKKRYEILYRDLKEYFGSKKLNHITHKQYQLFINAYGKRHVRSTVQKTDGTIRSCVQDAINDGIIAKDFTARINLVWNDDKSRKVEYLNYQEIKALKNTLLDGLRPEYVSRYMLLTIIYTGMRPGEIRVLTWNDIDFKHQEIHITKSWNYDKGALENYDSPEINKSTKNKSSVRVIRVDKKLLDLLNQLRVNRKERLFVNPITGQIPSSAGVNKILRKQLKKAGIDRPGFHFHSLRHSHVALLLFQGVSLYAISKRLGHSNMSITASTYAYMLDELKAKSDNQIVKILDEL